MNNKKEMVMMCAAHAMRSMAYALIDMLPVLDRIDVSDDDVRNLNLGDPDSSEISEPITRWCNAYNVPLDSNGTFIIGNAHYSFESKAMAKGQIISDLARHVGRAPLVVLAEMAAFKAVPLPADPMTVEDIKSYDLERPYKDRLSEEIESNIDYCLHKIYDKPHRAHLYLRDLVKMVNNERYESELQHCVRINCGYCASNHSDGHGMWNELAQCFGFEDWDSINTGKCDRSKLPPAVHKVPTNQIVAELIRRKTIWDSNK